MEYLKVKNWEKYQDYEKDNPPWIKLYPKLLQDYNFMNLPDTEKAAFFLILCYAAITNNKIPNDEKFLASLFCLDDTLNLKLLCDKGFLVTRDTCDTVTSLSQKVKARNRKRQQRQRDKEKQSHKNVTPKSRKETETETETDIFEHFWKAYPRKKSKGQAEKAWAKIKPKPNEQLLASMIATIEQAKKSEDWLKEGGQFIPYPATWLNAKGWEDEVIKPGGNGKDPFWCDSCNRIRSAMSSRPHLCLECNGK